MLYSSAATLTVNSLSITKQPENVSVAPKKTATFAVEADGNNLTYQWQYSIDNGSTWKNCSSTGSKTPSFSFSAEAIHSGRLYRCAVSDGTTTLESQSATLTIAPALTLTSPTDTTITSTQSTTFTVSSDSTISTYAWEYKLPNTSNWLTYNGTGSNTASITVDGATATSGTQYRCTVTDTYGQTKTSDNATLTIESATQNVTVNLWNTYSVYNTSTNPVNYTFTAQGAGYYYFNTTAHVTGNYENEDHQEGVFYTVDILSNEEEYRYLYSMAGDSKKDAFYLKDEQTITFTFTQEQLANNDYFEFSLESVKPDVATVSRIMEREATSESDYWCEFTAPVDGTYTFYADSSDEDGEAKPFFFMFGTTEWAEEMETEDGYIMWEQEMAEGETVYVRIRNYDEEDAENTSFKFGVAATVTEEMLTETLNPVGLTEGMEVEPIGFTINSNVAYFKLNAAEASTYMFDISNINQEEPMAVTFLNSYGFEIEPDGFIELESGVTNDDGMFCVEFDPFAFGDSDYIYVKLETSENNIGDMSIAYAYDADENVEDGDEDDDEEDVDIIATVGGQNGDSATINITSTSAIVKIENGYDSMNLYCSAYGNDGPLNRAFKAWISETTDFTDAEEIDASTEFVWYRPTGTYYVKIESVDENAVGGILVSFVDDGEYVEPVAEDVISMNTSTWFYGETMHFTAPSAGTYKIQAVNANGLNVEGGVYDAPENGNAVGTAEGEGFSTITYTVTLAEGQTIYMTFSAESPYSGPDAVFVTVAQDFIGDIPVIGTINDSWTETTFTTNHQTVYIKVLMADGPNYAFVATCSTENKMYVYAASDLETVVASDTSNDTFSRVLDCVVADESGYAYVKLVTASGYSLGTITCELEPAPMPIG